MTWFTQIIKLKCEIEKCFEHLIFNMIGPEYNLTQVYDALISIVVYVYGPKCFIFKPDVFIYFALKLLTTIMP